MANNIYLQVDFSSGNIFQWSKDEKEGYEAHTNTAGTKSYRKIYKRGLYAKFKGISLRDSNFGREISLYTELANGDTAYLNLPLLDQKKNLATYAESLITVLPSLRIGESYRFFPYNIKEDGAKYSKTGVSVVLADLDSDSVIEGADKPARLSYSYTKKDGTEVKGDIPADIWEEDIDGSKTKNAKARGKFLFDVLTKYISDTGGSTSTEKQETEPTKAQAPVETQMSPSIDDHDDLPF